MSVKGVIIKTLQDYLENDDTEDLILRIERYTLDVQIGDKMVSVNLFNFGKAFNTLLSDSSESTKLRFIKAIHGEKGK